MNIHSKDKLIKKLGIEKYGTNEKSRNKQGIRGLGN